MNTAHAMAEQIPEGQDVPHAASSPVSRIEGYDLRTLGQNLSNTFTQFKGDRRLAELRWLRAQRQYLGVYDPEVERGLEVNRSRAYPRVTRVKCISVLARLMSLMFPGDERNWEVRATPWPTMTMQEMQDALSDAAALDKAKGIPTPSPPDINYITAAVQVFADRRAEQMSRLIDDQMQELGGDQTDDYVSLNRTVIRSGIIYGLGVLRGPFARASESVVWNFDNPQMPMPRKVKVFKPMYEFLPVWDFYPDMAAKTFKQMDAYFVRQIFSRHEFKKLGDRHDFIKPAIDAFLETHTQGNYKPEWFESDLRQMGVRANVNDQKTESTKYEVLCFHGTITGWFLRNAGVEVDDDKVSEDIDAEVWMIDGNIIRCVMNPWRELDVDMPMIHPFVFDEDDTSPVGFGLPSAIRDSQMAIAAATRMLLDNASVVCGPNIEINMDLMRPDQDLRNIGAYKVWYREGDGPEAQWPAVRNVQVDAHIDSLIKVIELFENNADKETFVGPATGGDMSKGPSEPLRTAAGASMLRGDAALPFKDIVRSFDKFTQSIIQSMVTFNRTFNPDLAPVADYDVIARGASSLMAKELRGMQADNLVATLTPEEKQEIDMRKLLSARVKARDMEDIMVDVAESNRRAAAAAQQASQQQDAQQRMLEGQIRKVLSDAYKNIASGQVHSASADATQVETALDLLERGIRNGLVQGGGTGPNQAGQPGVSGVDPGNPGGGGPSAAPAGGPQGPVGPGVPGNVPAAPGGM